MKTTIIAFLLLLSGCLTEQQKANLRTYYGTQQPSTYAPANSNRSCSDSNACGLGFTCVKRGSLPLGHCSQ